MVEKVVVSRDEVLHFSWLDHTWVYIYFTPDSVTTNPMFQKFLVALMRHGIRQTTGQECAVSCEGYYLFIRHDTNEIVDIIKNACQWLIKYTKLKDPSHPIAQFAMDHRDQFLAFLAETKGILEKETYTYYFQSVDGLN